jgi:hypothetical protein
MGPHGLRWSNPGLAVLFVVTLEGHGAVYKRPEAATESLIGKFRLEWFRSRGLPP